MGFREPPCARSFLYLTYSIHHSKQKHLCRLIRSLSLSTNQSYIYIYIYIYIYTFAKKKVEIYLYGDMDPTCVAHRLERHPYDALHCMHGTKSKLHETSTKMPLNMVVVFLFSPTMQVHMPLLPLSWVCAPSAYFGNNHNHISSNNSMKLYLQ
jgi:hypothetical protein